MMQTRGSDTLDEELDRLGELANIGAGHAATAFGRLTQRTIWTEVPRVLPLNSPSPAHDEWCTGVFFEFEGYIDALVAISSQHDSKIEFSQALCQMFSDRQIYVLFAKSTDTGGAEVAPPVSGVDDDRIDSS